MAMTMSRIVTLLLLKCWVPTILLCADTTPYQHWHRINNRLMKRILWRERSGATRLPKVGLGAVSTVLSCFKISDLFMTLSYQVLLWVANRCGLLPLVILCGEETEVFRLNAGDTQLFQEGPIQRFCGRDDRICSSFAAITV